MRAWAWLAWSEARRDDSGVSAMVGASVSSTSSTDHAALAREDAEGRLQRALRASVREWRPGLLLAAPCDGAQLRRRSIGGGVAQHLDDVRMRDRWRRTPHDLVIPEVSDRFEHPHVRHLPARRLPRARGVPRKLRERARLARGLHVGDACVGGLERGEREHVPNAIDGNDREGATVSQTRTRERARAPRRRHLRRFVRGLVARIDREDLGHACCGLVAV